MLPNKIGAAIIGLAFVPLLAMALIWGFGGNGAPVTSGSERPRHAASSVGASRDAKLLQLTQQYISLNGNISAGVRAGAELAPIEFLNRKLEREGVKWRVRQTDGLVADTYDIS